MVQQRKIGDPYASMAVSLHLAVEHAAARWGVDLEVAGDVSLADERAGMVARSVQDSGFLQGFFRMMDGHLLSRFDQSVAAYEAAEAPYGETVNGILRWYGEASAEDDITTSTSGSPGS